MSTTIDVENLKAIRKPFDVICGVDMENTTATNNISYDSGDVGFSDDNEVDALKSSAWEPLRLADLSGGGFPLDDGVIFPSQTHEASGIEGKYGLRGYVGESLEISVTTSASTVSITCEGTGTLTVNGAVYPLQDQFVIPVRAGVEETLLFESTDEHARVVVYTIVPGIVLQFKNDAIVSCVLDLAGNLSLTEPSFEVSTIELNAYYPYDISEIISTMPDNTPLWYKAGYPGDYCETRMFYLDGEATMKDRVITLKGTDASSRLEGVTMRSKLVRNAYQLYVNFHNTFNRAGITLVDYEEMPSDSSTTYAAIVTEQSAQDLLGDMMVSCHAAPLYYWPTYVDAGIPRLYYKQVSEDGTTRSPYQLRVWDIHEEDCAEVERVVSRKISKIASADHDTPFLVRVTLTNTNVTVGSKTVVAGEIVEFTYSNGYLWNLVRTNTDGSVIYADQQGQKWIANANGTASLTGNVLSLSKISDFDIPTPAQNGIVLYMNPVILGYLVESYAGSIPTNIGRFFGSNVTGSFTFRGDPRMQPRDTFRFTRLDGTVEVATVERIEMTHEGGGTTASVHYRLGVV